MSAFEKDTIVTLGPIKKAEFGFAILPFLHYHHDITPPFLSTTVALALENVGTFLFHILMTKTIPEGSDKNFSAFITLYYSELSGGLSCWTSYENIIGCVGGLLSLLR